MELQQLTEQMLLAVTSLNRSCIPQSVQEHLKGENFLLTISARKTAAARRAHCGGSGVSALAHGGDAARALEEKGCRAAAVDCCDRSRVVVHLTELGRQTAEQARRCAHVQRVLEQLGRAGHAGIDPALGRITEIEARA